jgi:heme-degrading monooxygenase HmoA
MIFRIWHGWTTAGNANAYEALLRAEVLPGIHRIAGFHGAYLLRKTAGDDVEFITICVFDDYEAVRRFAGDDYAVAVVPPHAQKLLLRYDARAEYYEVLMTPEQVRAAAAVGTVGKSLA